jgi:hypothetical protein
MEREDGFVPLAEASHEVEVAMTRLALLHLSFSNILIEEFGLEKGRELIVRSIMEYGERIGERTKRGLPDLPKYGVCRMKGGKAYDCVLAKVFHEYDEEDIGSLYCYIDPAKTMAKDPCHKLVHKECAACGDDHCSYESMPTTEKERNDFKLKKAAWMEVDPRLVPNKER